MNIIKYCCCRPCLTSLFPDKGSSTSGSSEGGFAKIAPFFFFLFFFFLFSLGLYFFVFCCCFFFFICLFVVVFLFIYLFLFIYYFFFQGGGFLFSHFFGRGGGGGGCDTPLVVGNHFRVTTSYYWYSMEMSNWGVQTNMSLFYIAKMNLTSRSPCGFQTLMLIFTMSRWTTLS